MSTNNEGPLGGHPSGASFGAPAAAAAPPVAASATPSAPAPAAPPLAGALFGGVAPSVVPPAPEPAPGPAAPPPAPVEPPAVVPPAPTTAPAVVDPNAFWAAHPDPAVRELMGQKAYADPNALATAYYNANKLIGGAKDVVAIPADNAPADAWEKFYASIGRPATAAEYQIQLPEGAKADPAMVEFGRSFFHKLGVSQRQVPEALGMWEGFVAKQNANFVASQAAEATRANTEALASTEASWAGGTFKADMARGQQIVASLGLDNADLRAAEAAVGSAAIAKIFGKIGQKLGKEAEFVNLSGASGRTDPLSDPAAATAEIARLRADPTFTAQYNDPRSPQHAQALATMDNLYRAQRVRS